MRPTPAPRATSAPLLLVASALDERSDDVVASAWRLANALDGDLLLAHAVAPPHLAPGVPPASDAIARLVDDAAQRLQAQADRLRPAGARAARLSVVPGPPDLVIGGLAAEQAPELIVVGATTSQGRLGKLLGSTAERLLQTATVPVLVVRDELPVPPRRVLAPLDLSLFSTDALRCGAHLLGRLAERSPAAPIRCELLTVVPVSEAVSATALALGNAQAGIETLAGELRSPGVSFAPRVLAGEPRDQILRALEEVDCDLVLMGTHGAGGLRRTLGTVAADVAREAPASVLLVPPRASLGEALASAVAEQLASPWSGERSPQQQLPRRAR